MTAVHLHYELSGPTDAPVLVLAGPLGGTLRLWDRVVQELDGRFQLLRYDHRGHGGSPVPQGPYTMADLGGDVLALLDRLGIERATLCGISMGGMVGIWLGAHAPQRLSALVLCCTTAHSADPGPWLERAERVRQAGTASLAPEVVARWFTPDWAARHQDVVHQVRQIITDTSDEGYAACCAAIATWDGRLLLSRISAPTLVIAGATDPSTPATPHAQTIAEGIPGAKLEVLDAAHLVIVEQAKRVSDLLADHAGPR